MDAEETILNGSALPPVKNRGQWRGLKPPPSNGAGLVIELGLPVARTVGQQIEEVPYAAVWVSGAGTGLGLAITRAIVEAHEGTVAVTSDGVGQGVTVTCRLPLNK